MSGSTNFPKFIKASTICRTFKYTTYETGFGGQQLNQLTGKTTKYKADTPLERTTYVRLQDIVEFQPVTEGELDCYIVFVDRSTFSGWAKITDENSLQIINRYLKESQMDSNQDLVRAISDVKEFIKHLPK